MSFKELINKYIEMLDCSVKELSMASGLSSSTISRYRSGERKPFADSEQLESIVKGIIAIAKEKNIKDICENEVYFELKNALTNQSDEYNSFSKNFAIISDKIKINMKSLAAATNFDISYLYRIRQGQRRPNDLDAFADMVCEYIVKNHYDDNSKEFFVAYTGQNASDIKMERDYSSLVKEALFLHQSENGNSQAESFLKKLDEFNLNEYIRAIHFDKLKVPFVPFYFPVSKNYYGIEEMRQGELDFFKATVLSKSHEPIFMCSDMPMTKLAEDMDFNKKWMFAIAMALKKGLHLNIIHNLDRPFEELMLGLEAWIPLYMTGQIAPYHIVNNSTEIYHHFTYVSGSVALSGECIDGYHEAGKYYLATSKEEVQYYRKKSELLMQKAEPLMEIYTKEDTFLFDSFIKKMNASEKNHYNIWSTLPVYTLSKELLLEILQMNNLLEEEINTIVRYYEDQRKQMLSILKNQEITDDLPVVNREEYDNNPFTIPLSDIFSDKEIKYSYQQYIKHLELSKAFAKEQKNYYINENYNPIFRNIQIRSIKDDCVLISKSKTPVIHFAIYHPKLVDSIQNFVGIYG